MNENEDTLKISYYLAADGPTVLIVSRSDDTIALIHHVVTKLAAGEKEDIRLDAYDPVRLDGLSSLVMRVDNRKSTVDKTLYIKDRDNPDGPMILWVKSQEGWDITRDFIGSLMKSGGGCHQYLTSDYSDDAEVELSYKEEGVG